MFPTPLRLALLAVGLSAAVAAQDLTVRAVTDASVLARSGAASDLQTIKSGASATMNEGHSQLSLLSPTSATVTTSTGTARLGLRAGCSPMEFVSGRGFARGLHAIFLYLGSASGDGSVATTPATSAANAKPGPVSFLITFKQPKNVTGNLDVSWSALSNSNNSSTASIDVGNNNKVDLSLDSSKETLKNARFPVSFAGGDVTVKVTFSSSAGNAPAVWNAFQSLRVSLLRQGACQLKSYGPVCGNARLDAGLFTISRTSIFNTQMTGAANSGFFVRVVGTKRVDMPLPGTCKLLAEPIVIQLLQADAIGSYKEAFTVPANQNFTVTIQYVPFELSGSQLKVSSTNAWELSCSGF